MRQKREILLFPWNQPFLPALLDEVRERCAGDIGRALLVFPHARPIRYLTDLVREHPGIAKPCILPRMEPVTRLFDALLAMGRRSAAVQATMLDLAALSHRAVLRVRREYPDAFADLPVNDEARFLPWGLKLAALAEEMLLQDCKAADFAHMEGEVSPFAAALLANLSRIHAAYCAELERASRTTAGLTAGRALEELDSCRELAGGRQVFICGFHALTGTEEKLFRHLYEELDATICVHGDPALASGSGHWSCAELRRWASRWRAQLVPAGPEPDPDRRPLIRFRAGFDLHSQLQAMEEDIRQAPDSPSAVILPQTGLLLPVLHHLPRRDLNVSMGYPLSRAPLFRLLETLLSLQETRRDGDARRYHWKSLVALLRHPYLKMLGRTPDASLPPLRPLFQSAERMVRTGRRYVAVDDIIQAVAGGLPPGDPAHASLPMFRQILKACTAGWEDARSPASLARALEGLVDLLLENGGGLWQRFPLDGESLYRLMQSVIPQLAHSELSHTELKQTVLFALFRQLTSGERVPFEADPLVGLQVLGPLESRLLTFERVYFPDMTDDAVPGTASGDPLLPDVLRPHLGLPDSRSRQQVAAYTFFRLLAGCREAFVYWQEGVEPQGLSDGKKQRSRFIEELIWQEEKRTGRILAPEEAKDAVIRQLACNLPPLRTHRPGMALDGETRQRLDGLLAEPLSPSLLDSYLRCPARFFHERLGRLREPETVIDREDPRALGDLMHQVLYRFYQPRLGVPMRPGRDEEQEIRLLFQEELAQSNLAADLPPDALIMLEAAAPDRLAAMLREQGETLPLAVEEEIRATVRFSGREYLFQGKLDRVDEREGKRLILDYKTGRVPRISSKVWQDEAFWERLNAWDESHESGLALLRDLAGRFASIQLPVYCHVYSLGTGQDVHDAAYVEMRDMGKERYLFGEELDDEDRDLALSSHVPAILGFLTKHMRLSHLLEPSPGPYCDWCPFQKSCIVLAM